ncbi:peptidyl-prolyl cis-trans isomerase D [Klebsiella aerogenes]|nr:peptidyl-prolyl cis-trans isomerase D [Klebsiella aerogenes]
MGSLKMPSPANVTVCSSSLATSFSELAANENYMKTMRQQVLNRLIDESLLDQYARELGLSISDEQVKQAIFQTQAFPDER